MYTKNEFMDYVRDHLAIQESERANIERAYDFGAQSHTGQLRASGEKYFESHSVGTAMHLIDIGMGPNMVIAGLLHDVVEDTPVTIEEIEATFGHDIAHLVEGVSKLGELKYHGNERHVESLRKFFVAASSDVRVLILKLCDRWHNLETLEYLPPAKRQRIALESMMIHGAIASRLNMGKLTGIINDLAFPYAMPDEYKKTIELRENILKREDKIIEEMYRDTLHILTESLGYTPHVDRRKKGLYSFYKKMERYDWNAEKIYDLMAIRAIVRDESDCYKALGAIHGKWRPVPGRIKDYIATPKPNGYQSLHTSVFTGRGNVLEVQIRTQAMHDFAEYGIASHHTYKVDSEVGHKGKFDWISQLGAVKREDQTQDEYLKELKTDFFADRIFAMTPEGDVIDLPQGATILDFAFAVHTELGLTAQGGKINGNYKALKTPLASEDIVEIVPGKLAKPTTDWLEWSVTNLAHSRIRKALGIKRKFVPAKKQIAK